MSRSSSTNFKKLYFRGCLACVLVVIVQFIIIIVLFILSHYREPTEYTSPLPRDYKVWKIDASPQSFISRDDVRIFPWETNFLEVKEFVKFERLSIANDRYVLLEARILNPKSHVLRYYILDTAPMSISNNSEPLRIYLTQQDALTQWRTLCNCLPKWVKPWNLPGTSVR